MTRVDFYILDGDSGDLLQRFACRLVDKAWQKGLRCFINAADASQAAGLDDLMWTFRDVSFIPHAAAGSGASDRLVVVIGSGEEPPDERDLLINLGDEVPPYFSRFERVAEIIDGDARRRDTGRERFRYYRDRGYPLESHKVR